MDETVGFMDIGTNSIHIMVARFSENSMTVVFRDKEIIRLGRDLYSKGRVGPESIEKCRLATDRFTETARNMGATKVIAYATCAAREAVNRTELIDALDSDGLDVRIIPGPEEARLIRLGVFGDGPEDRTLLIDIGGGSTEIALSEKGNDLYLDSLDIGAVRYAYSGSRDPEIPMDDALEDRMRRDVTSSSYRAVRTVRALGFVKAVGSSGTMVTLAELCAARRDDNDRSYFTLPELRDLMSSMRKMDLNERLKLNRMNPARADIILAGGTIAEELMNMFGVERMHVSDSSLKDGMLAQYMSLKGDDEDVRTSSVLSLADRCQYDREHAEDVRKKSSDLFDSLKAAGVHDMTDDMKSILEHAATLHDIGELIDYTRHHINSYNMIINSNMLGFDDQELETIALIAKFHHKRFPDLRDKNLRRMTRRSASDLLRCAMLLRIADVTDRHRSRSVERIETSVKKGKVTLTLISSEDARMETWGIESMAADFKKVFGRELKISFKKGNNQQ